MSILLYILDKKASEILFLTESTVIFASESKMYIMKHLILFILFSLTFSLGNAYAEGQSKEPQEISVSVSDNRLYIIGAAQGSSITIKNMLGEKVFMGVIKNDKDIYDLNLKSGFYIVQIGDVLKRIIVK
jgi:hypothetical protein